MYTIDILRRDATDQESYWQQFNYEPQSDIDTIATVLMALNEQDRLTDINGQEVSPIIWEHSCLQKKCGACAMVINGRPMLACDARLGDFKNHHIKVEPLRKFPVIKDLMVDRSILYRNLEAMRLWLEEDATLSDSDQDLAYRASECIQCGCCLDICPNFYVDGAFYGMATVPLTTRLLLEMSPQEAKKVAKEYSRHVFAGCGKSLSCHNVCPRKIDTENLLVNANALAVWRRRRKRK